MEQRMGWAGGAVRTQGLGGGRQRRGSSPGHLGAGWRGARASGSGGPGWEAVERPFPLVLKPPPCTRWGLGACSFPQDVQGAPSSMCGQVHTPAHLHTHVYPYPRCTLRPRVHTQLPRPDCPEATLAPRTPHPQAACPAAPHCPPRPHFVGQGRLGPAMATGSHAPSPSCRMFTRGSPAGAARPQSGRHSGPGTRGPWWAARVFGQGSGRAQALEPPPLLLAAGPDSWPASLFLRVLYCLCVLMGPILSPHLGSG